MQSLSLHLRPAPYPYGLLTLRLLGKLGGKNRQFLREPMPFIEVNGLSVTTRSYSTCSWSRVEEVGEMSDASITMTLPLPITECVEILRSIALQPSVNEKGRLENIYRRSDSFLWECKIEELDFVKSSHEIVTGVENDQAAASFTIVSAAMKKRFDRDTSSENDKNEVICSRDDNFLCLGLFYACMIDSTCEGAWALVKSTVMAIDCGIIADSLCQVLSQPSSRATSVGMAMLDFLLDGKLIKNLANRDSLCQALVCVLCDACCSSSWERQSGLQDALRSLTSTMGGEWSRKYEVRLINATLQPVKTVPRELTEASVCALRVFIMMCSTLYGERWTLLDGGTNIVRDILSSKKETDWSDDIDGGEKSELTGLQATNTIIFPCDAVFKITVYELTSPQQLSRYEAL